VHDPTDPQVWETLKKLHPPGRPVRDDDVPPNLPTSLGDDDLHNFWDPLITAAINSFPRGTAPGPSGLRASHLQDSTRRPGRGATLVAALARLTHMWVNGSIPPDLAPTLCGANLTPLRKKDNAVRPVAVGEVIRRLVGKALLSTGVAKRETATMAPHQVGVGVPRACESVAMGLTSLVNHLGPHSQQWAAILIDISSAFQGVDRTAVLKAAGQDTPSLFNYLRFTLSRSSPLYSGGRIIYSEAGVPQGCPLGPAAFSLGIQSLLTHISNCMGLIWNVWYLDDGLLVGDPDKIGLALQYLETELTKRGLAINRGKCVLWGPAANAVPNTQDISITPWEPGSGITLLGAPIAFPGTTDYSNQYWAERLQALEHATTTLTSLADKQMAHHLLRHCLDGCKVNHLLRVSDPYTGPDHSAEADEIILSAFEDIVGCSLTVTQRAQASLPFSAGGCGIKVPTTTRPAARMSAILAYCGGGCHNVGVPVYAHAIPSAWIGPLIEDLENTLGTNFDPLPKWKGRHELLSAAEPTMYSQKFWSDALGKARVRLLLDTTPPRDQARLMEQSSGVGTCWMSVTPNATLHTTITSEEYSLALKWWLGAPIFPQEEQERTCPGCGRIADIFGDHLLCCARNNFTKRHQAVQDALAEICSTSGQGFTREVQIPDSPDGELRPADLLLAAFQSGAPTALDITVAHGWQHSEQTTVSRERWRTFLRRKEQAKHSKYDAPCKQAGWGFLAAAFGTWGGLGPEGSRVLHRLVKRAAGWQEGELRGARQREIMEGIGLALMRQVWSLLGNKNHFFR